MITITQHQTKLLQNSLRITWPPLAVFVLHLVLLHYHLYYFVWWIDTPMHFLGGAAITLMTYLWLRQQSWGKDVSPLGQLVLLVGAAGIAAILWECYEFTEDVLFFTHNQPDLADTMKDLCMGLLGAITVAFSTKK
jgi:hypothetical protein